MTQQRELDVLKYELKRIADRITEMETNAVISEWLPGQWRRVGNRLYLHSPQGLQVLTVREWDSSDTVVVR